MRLLVESRLPSMLKFRFVPPAQFLRVPSGAGLLAFCLLAACAHGQSQAQNPPAGQHPATAPSPLITKVANPDELLAKANKLYYSYKATGLDGFDCAVHPDWKKIVGVASKGATDAEDEQDLQLLDGVKIKLHARLMDESTLDWDDGQSAGKPLDASSTAKLTAMHRATQQTIQGFLQFWTPFINGSVVPASSEGLDITESAKGYKVIAAQGDSTVTEHFDPKLVLQEFHVAMSGASINFAPSYKATDKGLLVSSFIARIQPPGTAAGQSQEMRVAIDYQTVDGFPIPGKLSMSGAKTGQFDFVFNDCSAHLQAK